MGKLDPIVSWMMEEIEGIQGILRKVAPRYRNLGRDVMTLPPEAVALETGAQGIQRAPNGSSARGAWAELPAIPHALGTPRLVAPAAPFKASLASSQTPSPILAPLSHGRSLEAPKGIVSGIARPTSTLSGPALPAPVQRSPLGARRSAAGDELDLAASVATEESGSTSASPPATPAEQRSEAAATPIRRLEPVVGASMGAKRALTQAPEPAAGKSVVGFVGQPRQAGVAHPAKAMPEPAVQRSPARPPAAEPTAPPVPLPGPTQALPGAPRLTIGQVRRLGLGSPVAGRPVPGATSTAGGTSDGAGTAPQRAPAGPAGMSIDATTGIQRAPAVDAAELPLAGGGASAASHGEPGHAHGEGEGESAMPSVQRSPAVPARARPLTRVADQQWLGGRAPIVSAQPLRTGIQRAPLTLPQRAPDGTGADTTTATASPSTSSSVPVKIRRDGQATQLSTALDARSFTHGGEIFLPASHGPLTSGTGKALLAHEMTHVAQQRRLGSSLPVESSPHGQSLESEAVAAERSPDMTLARPHADASATAPTISGGDGPAAPGRTATTAVHASGAQRAPADGSMSTGTRSPAPTTPTGAGQGSGRHTHSEQELEVLAHQLYHRIGRHLRRELLVDRERVGFALDLP